MTARLVEPQVISPERLLAAAERVLVHPSCNVQRVSMDEIYTFALATTQFTEICGLSARQIAGAATADELTRLRTHLIGLGFLPAGDSPPGKETTDVR